ncbi:Multiple exostoses homolog 1 [Galdieria sulphuraria]|nr:Multiple exostoses homolog 1 [Galdieria sulphuraria]
MLLRLPFLILCSFSFLSLLTVSYRYKKVPDTQFYSPAGLLYSYNTIRKPMYGHHGLSELDNKRLLRLLKAAASRVRDIKEEKYAMTYRSIETISWPKQYVPFCNWFLLPCNTTTCTAKCISLNYTIYIYSHDDMRRAARRNLSDEILRFGGAGTSQVVNELRRSNRVTQNASDACYFIAENKGRHIYKLQDLPYWNLGINHMVLDFLDGKVR